MRCRETALEKKRGSLKQRTQGFKNGLLPSDPDCGVHDLFPTHSGIAADLRRVEHCHVRFRKHPALVHTGATCMEKIVFLALELLP